MDDDILIRFRLVGEEARALKAMAAKDVRRPRDVLLFLLRRELAERKLLPATEKRAAECDR